MGQSTSKIDFLKSNDTSLIRSTQTIVKKRSKMIFCDKCNKIEIALDESHQICHDCYRVIAKLKLSGNKIIDDFIIHTQINFLNEVGRMAFVSYDQFKNIEFIAEGGFSKIYKATWTDGPVIDYYNDSSRSSNEIVVLKNLIILRTSHPRS